MNLIDEKKYADLLQQASRLVDENGIEQFIRNVRDEYKLQHVAFSVVVRGKVTSVVSQHSTYSEAWKTFYRKHSLDNIDPLVRNSHEPVIWSKLDELSEPEKMVMDERAKHGIGPNGLSIPVVTSDGSTSVLSITDDSFEPAVWNKRAIVLLKELLEVGMIVHTALVLRVGHAPPPAVRLSKTHVDCLRMIGYGMPVASIARFMGLSQKTIKKSLLEAGKRLHASNNAQLIYNAMKAGIID